MYDACVDDCFSIALKYQNAKDGPALRFQRGPFSLVFSLWSLVRRSLKFHLSTSVSHFPGFSRDFDSFDSENQWDGIVVFVGF